MSAAVAITGTKFRAWDDNGVPLAFGKVYTFQAGTNNPKVTYTSEEAITANANPVILNGQGYADICLSGSYKIVVEDRLGNIIHTTDPVTDPGSLAKDWVNEQAATQISPTEFKVTGNLTDVYVPGRALQLNDASLIYGYVDTAAYLSGETFVAVDSNDALTNQLNKVSVGVCRSESLPNGGYVIAGSKVNSFPTMNDLPEITVGSDGLGVTVTDSNHGGPLTVRENLAKTMHDGVRYFDPLVDLDALGWGTNAAAYTSANAGLGVYERPDNELTSYNAGVVKGDTATDYSAAIEALYNIAYTSGVAEIEIGSNDITILTQPAQVGNVMYSGEGSFIGAGSYRTRKKAAQKAVNFVNTVASQHLTRFLTAENPVVVLVGDSLSTPGPNAISPMSSFWGGIVDKIKADNPDKDITFYNRAIGGLSWSDIDAVASTNFPEWYVPTTDPWLDFVSVLNPDLVIFSSGMNDAYLNAFNASHVTSVVSKVNSWAKTPDIIFVTTPVPTNSNPFQALFTSKTEQEARDFNAGWIRTYCNVNGYGYLDVNRQCNLVRDGVDVVDSSLIRVDTGVVPATGSYFAPADSECRDYSLQLTIPDHTAYSNANTLAVKTGRGDSDFVFIVDSGGKLRFDFYYGQTITGGATLYSSVVSDIDTPVTSGILSVTKKGNVITVTESNDARIDSEFRQDLICGGGLYQPKAGWFSDGFATGPISLVTFNKGLDIQVDPVIGDEQMWGQYAVDAGTKLPSGGNGINHPTALGYEKLYKDVIDSSNFGGTANYVFADGTGGYSINEKGDIRQWINITEVSASLNALVAWPIAYRAVCYGAQASSGIPVASLIDVTNGELAQTIVNIATPQLTGVRYSSFYLTEPALARNIYIESYGK